MLNETKKEEQQKQLQKNFVKFLTPIPFHDMLFITSRRKNIFVVFRTVNIFTENSASAFLNFVNSLRTQNKENHHCTRQFGSNGPTAITKKFLLLVLDIYGCLVGLKFWMLLSKKWQTSLNTWTKLWNSTYVFRGKIVSFCLKTETFHVDLREMLLYVKWPEVFKRNLSLRVHYQQTLTYNRS